jgi:hypothetical protein
MRNSIFLLHNVTITQSRNEGRSTVTCKELVLIVHERFVFTSIQSEVSIYAISDLGWGRFCKGFLLLGFPIQLSFIHNQNSFRLLQGVGGGSRDSVCANCSGAR